MKLLPLVCLAAFYALCMSSARAHRCKTDEFDHDDALHAELREEFNRFDALNNVRSSRQAQEILTIPVIFHVIHTGTKGNIPYSRIEAQMRQLNKGFAGNDGPVLEKDVPALDTNIRFKLHKVNRVKNAKYFNNCATNQGDDEMKRNLAESPGKYLNVYTCNGKDYLGWVVYFPNERSAGHYGHGVVLSTTAFSPNRLDTLAHEVGHYLGLDHTFYGGCSGNGDGIGDTPFEAQPFYGSCTGVKKRRDTCKKKAGTDPYWDFMDYTNDNCMYTFTQQQINRMRFNLRRHKPNQFTIGGGTTEPNPTPTPPPTDPPSNNGGNFCQKHGLPIKRVNGKQVCAVVNNKGGIFGKNFNCLRTKFTHAQAKEQCAKNGMRLCTAGEIKAKVIQAASSTLAGDCRRVVSKTFWTAASCNRGAIRISGQGQNSNCSRKGAKFHLACCAVV